MDKIVSAIPLDNFCVDIVTSSGVRGIFDVKPYLGGGAFKDLHEASYFRLVRPAHHGIMWPNEQDFSADTIVWDMQHAHADSALQANEITLAAMAAARSGNVQSFPNIHAPMADLNATEAKRS